MLLWVQTVLRFDYWLSGRIFVCSDVHNNLKLWEEINKVDLSYKKFTVWITCCQKQTNKYLIGWVLGRLYCFGWTPITFVKNKIVKTKLIESEMKLYLSGDQTYKAGGTLKGYQVNSVRGGNCPSETMGFAISRLSHLRFYRRFCACVSQTRFVFTKLYRSLDFFKA